MSNIEFKHSTSSDELIYCFPKELGGVLKSGTGSSIFDDGLVGGASKSSALRFLCALDCPFATRLVPVRNFGGTTISFFGSLGCSTISLCPLNNGGAGGCVFSLCICNHNASGGGVSILPAAFWFDTGGMFPESPDTNNGDACTESLLLFSPILILCHRNYIFFRKSW